MQECGTAIRVDLQRFVIDSKGPRMSIRRGNAILLRVTSRQGGQLEEEAFPGGGLLERI